MHCSWPATSFWKIASMRIRFPSGLLGVYLLHCRSPTNSPFHQLHQIHYRTSPAIGASRQSLGLRFSAVPLLARITSSGGFWGVSQVRREQAELKKSSRKMLANWLDYFPVVLETLLVHLEMMALVLGTEKGGTFESCHNHFGAGYVLATVAHNLEILGLRCW